MSIFPYRIRRRKYMILNINLGPLSINLRFWIRLTLFFLLGLSFSRGGPTFLPNILIITRLYSREHSRLIHCALQNTMTTWALTITSHVLHQTNVIVIPILQMWSLYQYSILIQKITTISRDKHRRLCITMCYTISWSNHIYHHETQHHT